MLYRASVDTSPVTEGITLFKYQGFSVCLKIERTATTFINIEII